MVSRVAAIPMLPHQLAQRSSWRASSDSAPIRGRLSKLCRKLGSRAGGQAPMSSKFLYLDDSSLASHLPLLHEPGAPMRRSSRSLILAVVALLMLAGASTTRAGSANGAPWATSLRAMDGALAAQDFGAAERTWQEAY